jgi:phospholipid/cholesterol/gamma-HCH transport system substrate-binding protein
MRRAIREHLRDFIAITVLFFSGLLITGFILSQQQQPYPSWIPILGDDRVELKADLSTAQAVIPGQGQTVNIAGVKAGDISDVQLEDGHAVVTMLVEPKYAQLIHTDATALLRPRTGLQDMTLELDPGTEDAPTIAEGATLPLSQTEPNVNPDQILASLDGDTRSYLQLLVEAGGEGLGGRGKKLSAGLRRFEPLARDLARVNGALIKRRENIRRSITSLRQIADALGRTDTQLAEFVTAQNEAIGGFADQAAALRESLQELPSTLKVTRSALTSSDELSLVLGPASRELIPAAEAFVPAQRDLQAFLRRTLSPISDQIRPFSHQVQPPVRHLGQAAQPLAQTTKSTAASLSDLNRLFNAWAYNPPGPQEGYLFWTAWLNHNGNSAALLQDANGPLARGVVMQSCATARLAESLAIARPFIKTLQEYTNAPKSSVICPLDPSATAGGFPGLGRPNPGEGSDGD